MRHLTELKAVEQLWPDVPHQTCQFHALSEASRPAYEVDRKIKKQMRKVMQRQHQSRTPADRPTHQARFSS